MQAMKGFAAMFRTRTRLIGSLMAMSLALLALVFAATASAAAGPPVVETKPAGGINQTEANLQANVNPNGSEVTSCSFEYGTTVAYGSSVSCNQKVPFGGGNKGVNAMVKGLSAGTTYHYRISATNGEGTSMGADSSFKTQSPPHQTYLCLGDSLAFGYSQQLFNENYPGEDPNKFEHGYCNDYLKALESASAKGVWRLTDNGCPGETTESMIGNGPLSKEMASLGATGEAPCAYHYAAKYHLHHEYGDHHSQLENTLEVIKEANKDNNPDHPVTNLTLNIGANDELHQVAKCEAEVQHEYETEGKSKYGATPEQAVKNCIGENAFPLFKRIITNVSAMLYVIRNGSKYCVNINESETGKCDAGHKGVNYTGKIEFLGGYDPYGRVFCVGESFSSTGNAPESCPPGEELLPESNTLTLVLNFQEEKEYKAFGVCFANPQPIFNPGIAGHPENEPFKLQTLTNMDNKTTSNGKANGNGKTSDIHPTPLGYSTLSGVIAGVCGA